MDFRELAALGIDPGTMIDFSASLNPLGPPEEIISALSTRAISQYPEPHSDTLVEAIATKTGASPDRVVAAAGSAQIIHVLAQAMSSTAEKALIPGPTFGEYRAACENAGLEVIETRSSERDGFAWDIDHIVGMIRDHRPELVFLCNPNNPTGTLMAGENVERIADALNDFGTLALDDAYAAFAESPPDSLSFLARANVFLIRSMTKEFAIPGLRAGYAIGPPDLVTKIRRLIPSWSVSGPAQEAMLTALTLDSHVEAGRVIVAAERSRFEVSLRDAGISFIPSSTNFMLIKVNDGASTRSALLRHGICVRDCASFGLPNHIRTAIRQAKDMDLLLGKLRSVAFGDR